MLNRHGKINIREINEVLCEVQRALELKDKPVLISLNRIN